MPVLHVKSQVKWFSEQIIKGTVDESFRSDQMCKLVLTCCLFMDAPNNFRIFCFTSKRKSATQGGKSPPTPISACLFLIITNLVMVINKANENQFKCNFSFLFNGTRLQPIASEEPFRTLFLRELFLVYRKVNSEVADVY